VFGGSGALAGRHRSWAAAGGRTRANAALRLLPATRSCRRCLRTGRRNMRARGARRVPVLVLPAAAAAALRPHATRRGSLRLTGACCGERRVAAGHGQQAGPGSFPALFSILSLPATASWAPLLPSPAAASASPCGPPRGSYSRCGECADTFLCLLILPACLLSGSCA